MKILSLDVGGTFIKSAVIRGADDAAALPRVPTPCLSQDEFLGALRALLRQAGGADGIALSLPGVLDEESGFMHTGGSLKFVRELDMPALIRAACGVERVSLVNDAKAGALGELHFGALTDVRSAAMVVIGTAIGGAVILNRQVLSGSHHFAGEFSYMANAAAFSPASPPTFWGITGGAHGVSDSYARLAPDAPALSPEAVFDRALAGEARARDAIAAYCDGFVGLLANIQCAVDPEAIAMGGGISAQPLFLSVLRERVRLFQDSPLVAGVSLREMRMPELCLRACRFRDNAMGAYCGFLQRYDPELLAPAK